MNGKALYAGEDQWCAVQGRDWVKVGDRHHHAGKSHNQECGGYPPWGDDTNNKTYGNSTWNDVVLYKKGNGGGGGSGGDVLDFVRSYKVANGGPRSDQLGAYDWFDGQWRHSRPLHRAAMRGEVNEIRALCKQGRDANETMGEVSFLGGVRGFVGGGGGNGLGFLDSSSNGVSRA